jgi:hypothetical protein
MKAEFLLPLVLGLLAFGMPTWADSAVPAGALTDNSNALAPDNQNAQSIASAPDFNGGDFSDTLPLFTMRLSRFNLSMDIGFLAQETVVGPNSLDGVGMMLTFKAGQP